MKNIIPAGVMCALLLSAAAQSKAENIELKLQTWKIQSQKPADGAGNIRDGLITLTRGKLGAEPYMLRAYNDVPVTPDTTFVLSYEVKVEGDGSAQGVIFNGDQQRKWDEKNLKYTESKNKCDFTQVSTIITSSKISYNLRLDLRANGANTTVTYKNITLNKLGEKKDIVLTPSNSSVTLDGKLDDPLWKDAVKLSPFHVLGDVMHQSTLKNEVLLAVKDGYLYIGYRLEEPNPAGIKAIRPADAAALENTLGIYADDCVETFLSTDQVSYAQVIVNAAGSRHWEQVNTGAPSRTWYPSEAGSFTGEWDAKSVVGANEWTCEKRIKLSDLFRKNIGGEQTLFVNFTRHRTQGKEENLTWVPLPGHFFAVPKEFAVIKLNLPAIADTSDNETPVAPVFTRTLSVPDLLLAGVPVKLTKNPGEFKLPLNIKINEQNVVIDSGVKKLLENALHVSGGGEAVLTLAVADVFDDPSLKAAEKEKLKSPEAFKIGLAPGKAAITGRTKDGVLRGIATLILMANRARLTDGSALPALTLYDAPRMAFRGWQVGGKSLESLKRTIDAGFLLRFNKLLIYLDSFGGPTLFPFDSYPVGGRTWTKPELVEAFNYARARGLEPIPYFASWGRTQYLKNMPGGAKLLVDDPEAVQKGYANLDAANPEACKVMLKLQEEIIDTLKPEGFCVALDEIHFGKIVTSPAAKAKNWKPSDWLVEAIKASDELFKKKGVKMYIWGDMLDPGQNGKHLDMTGKELLARLPKDIVILDWKYDGKLDYTVDYPSIKLFKECGFATVGCPWFRPRSIPSLAYSINKHQCAGLLLTSWNSTTISELVPEVIRATSLTAYYAWSPDDCDLEHLQFLPDAIMQGAAYWTGMKSPAGKITSLTVKDGLSSNRELTKMMGVPASTDTAFIGAPFKNYRGLQLEVFRKDGHPGAVVLTGRETASVIKNGDFVEGAGLSGWEIESVNAGIFSTENGTLKITRTVPKTFMRAYQDISIDSKKQYLIRYKVKTNGAGSSLAWTYSGDRKFKWDESKSVYSSSKEREWTAMEVQLPPNFASLRICFSVDKEGATAWFRDVELIEKNADSGTLPPAAAAVKTVVIPVNATARTVTFMHAVNRQIILENMDGENTMRKKFNGVIPGSYMVIYADGSKALIPLTYRVNIAAVNDPALGREMDAGLFGTLGGTVFVNLPTYTWTNPYPDKIIKSIEIMPGNTKDISLLVFGIALD